MKLRIEGNALRLRLTQKEVACLHGRGFVECAIRFDGSRSLRYSVVSVADAAEVSVNYDGDSIRVVLPCSVATAWAESNQVTIEGPRNSGVRILVEKDFQCLHNPAKRDPDAYPHPLTV
jgi:hypothetical protein